jgi:hypothetical protein
MVKQKPKEVYEIKEDSNDFQKKIKENLWIIISIILAIAVIILIYINFSGGMTGNVVSESVIRERVINFAESRGAEAEVLNVNDLGSLYEVILSMDGQQAPIYVTKDGNYLVPQSIPLTTQESSVDGQTTETPIEIEKTDNPVFKVFLSPYCPYGLQYMKGLIPVYDLLKDKADINMVHMGITHMNEEKEESMRQLCILNDYGKKEFFDYLRNIVYNEDAALCYNEYHGVNLQTGQAIETENVGKGEYFTECMTGVIKKAMSKAGINEAKINQCIENKGDDYYSASRQDANNFVQANNLQQFGSPTPSINGVKLKGQFLGRNPEIIKQAICSAYTEDSIPEECDTGLSTQTFSPGIGIAESNTGNVPTGVC